MVEKHTVQQENAEKIWEWLHNRGGLAIWKSINLSNPGASWTGPAMDKEGQPSTKPTWQAANQAGRIIAQVDEVVVSIPKEVARYHIGIRMGRQGLSMKVTDASTAKIRKSVDFAEKKFGKPSWYKFDYETQEAVIMIDDQLIPLADYAKEKGWK